MSIKVEIVSSKLVGPMYNGYEPKPVPNTFISLTVFDKVVEDDYASVLYVYKPPNPSNMSLEQGLRRALVEYPEMAGRFSTNENCDERVILLNDKGMRFIEATADCTLDEVVLFKPSTLSTFNPNERRLDELALVQLTRFTCGSLVLFFSSSHIVADGASASQFVVAWSQACRGLKIPPRPLYNRNIFVPRDPPIVASDHKNVEVAKRVINHNELMDQLLPYSADNVVYHKAHFTPEFIANLKSKANSTVPDTADGKRRPYSTFESLVAHIWRTMAKVRGLTDLQTTEVKISVNGRRRLKPCVPDEYFGNVVLAAFPQSRVNELLQKSLSHAAEGWKVPTVWPNLEADSWLGFPFSAVDFGFGKPYIFMPSFAPWEGVVYLVPSLDGDGSIDVYITLFEQHLNLFEEICFCVN
ncbi:agmatine coumaroyltransferase-2-like [Papaver somniferum]|uniref:agmatine coumaroyltransferase-2-like n=1 Tax=Papaver somniferum TaxID=3469 RepID=UPI000E6FFF95|nr:agmatine coumaroyltransferase-2-like [Papaver somniferum]